MNDDLQKKFDDLLFGIRRSVRYHDRRQGFFHRCHFLVMFIAVVFGSATVATFGAEIGGELPLWLRLIPAMLVTVFSALDLVVGLSNKAWRHADLRRRFIDLECQLEAGHATITGELVTGVTQQRLRIEAEEPPVLRVLDTLCHNELMRAMGYERERLIKVGFWQRLLAQLFDLREWQLSDP